MNDYDIKENYNVDAERFTTEKINKKNIYDFVSHTKTNFKPIELKIEKWPKYYEK